MDFAPSDIVAQIIADANAGIRDAVLANDDRWYLATNLVPDQPNEVLCVYDTMGQIEGKSGKGKGIGKKRRSSEQLGIQVLVRSIEQRKCYNKASDLANILDSVATQLVTVIDGVDSNTYIVHSLNPSSPILYAGPDEKRRFLYTINFMGKIS
jgi:hypothetical protein